MACDLEKEAADAEEMAQIGRPVQTPVPTFREKLKRFRDAQALNAGGDPPLVDDGVLALDRELHDGLVDGGEGEDDDDEVIAEDVTPKPKRRASTFNTFKPGTRQAKPTAPATSTPRNWWEIVKPGEQTKAAEDQRARMSSSKQAKRVSGSINED